MQMTNCGFVSITLIQKLLDFHFYAADAVCFVPMQFSFKFFTVIQKTNAGKPFQPAPTPIAVGLLQPFEITDIAADSDNFDVFNFAGDLEYAYW